MPGSASRTLHRARREAIEAFEEVVLEPWRERRPFSPTFRICRSHTAKPSPLRAWLHQSPIFPPHARAFRPAVSRSTCRSKRWGRARTKGCGPVPSANLPRPGDRGTLSPVSEGARVVAGTLGLIDLAQQRGASVEAHWSLNALNPYSVAELADVRRVVRVAVARTVLSADCRGCRESPVPVGISIVGRQEVMVTEHCVLDGGRGLPRAVRVVQATQGMAVPA